MKQIKIVLWDDNDNNGKNLMARYFCLNSKNPISIVLTNRGHEGDSCYIYKKQGYGFEMENFGSGSLDGYPTYFPSFLYITPTVIESQGRYFEKFLKQMPSFYISPDCKINDPINYIFRNYCDEKINFKEKYSLKDFFNNDPRTLLKDLYNYYKSQLTNEKVEFYNIEFEELESFLQKNDYLGGQMWYGINCFLISIEYIKSHFICSDLKDIYDRFETLIFEGNIKPINENFIVNFENINNFIISKLNKEFKGELCYVFENYIDINKCNKYKEDFKNINNNFDILSFGIIKCLKKDIISNFDILNNRIYYFVNSNYAEDGVKIFYNAKDNMKKQTNVIIPHNHNSGLPYCLNNINKQQNNKAIVNTLGIYPFREDYPYIEYSGSNIESICSRGVYEQHLNSIKSNFSEIELCLLLLDKNYLLDDNLFKSYYIDKLGFKTFIVNSIEQAKRIKALNKQLIVYLMNNDDENADGIIINDDGQIIENKKIGVILKADKIDDTFFKWNNNCDFFLLEYNKEDSFMDDIQNILYNIYSIKNIYDKLFGEL